MPQLEYAQGSIICSEGNNLEYLYIIQQGSVEALFNGYQFLLEKGDIIVSPTVDANEKLMRKK